jgi:pyruvate dehydrogenase E1 component
MYGPDAEDVFYYMALYNENHPMPARPAALTDDQIVRGLYPFAAASAALPADAPRTTLLGGGSIMQQVLRAQAILAERFGVAADVWSAPSYQLLRNQALEVDRWNQLHPAEPERQPLVTQLLADAAAAGPIVAASDWIRAWPDMIGRWVPGAYRSLGTDGFGRSDTREALRRFFEVDAEHIAGAVLSELARAGRITGEQAAAGIAELGIDPEAPFSLTH